MPIVTCVSGPIERRIELDELVEASRERIALRLRGRERITTWAGAAVFVTGAIALAEIFPEQNGGRFWLSGLLVAAYALVSMVEFEIGSGSAIPTQLVFVPMLFLLPPASVPPLVALALILSMVPRLRAGMPLGRLAVQLTSALHTLGPATVFAIAGTPPARSSSWPIVLIAVCSQMLIDFVWAFVHGRIVFGITAGELVRVITWVYAVDALLTPAGFAAAVAATQDTSFAFVGLPLAGLFAVFARERQGRIDGALELGQAYKGTALLLGDVVEADDAYTGSHSRDVVELSLAVADKLGLGPRERRSTELAALLHDVGKIRIPNEIINKPGALSPEEREVIETHTIEGERLLARVGGLLGDVGSIVRSCHERWDGAGYPDRLAGEQIPRPARIVMCCDAFNAMTTDRSYRKALPLAVAIDELRRNAGSQFDPAVVAALVAVAPSLVSST
jgi:HD-GYP domain-containing protein (c-di-GMP phosphodiesterase class II)